MIPKCLRLEGGREEGRCYSFPWIGWSPLASNPRTKSKKDRALFGIPGGRVSLEQAGYRRLGGGNNPPLGGASFPPPPTQESHLGHSAGDSGIKGPQDPVREGGSVLVTATPNQIIRRKPTNPKANTCSYGVATSDIGIKSKTKQETTLLSLLGSE